MEGEARYAKIGGFEGAFTGELGSEEGKLYDYELNFDPDYHFKQVFVKKTEPSGSGISNAREAKVDFRGAHAVAG